MITSLVHGIFEPRMNWAEIGLGGALVFSFMVVAGLAACVSAVSMLAASSRFPGIVATPGSSPGRKVDSFGATAIAFSVLALAFTGVIPWLGILAPIVAGWACVNTVRIYRSFTLSCRAPAAG
ncbi:hypothetical protein [Rhodococcus sp. IEGM1428]|uniref:hypothetical protein n=1 Tax=Rhodococcus sp. IEGM1428 TaxID=3392191 RepID=UPI003D0C5842